MKRGYGQWRELLLPLWETPQSGTPETSEHVPSGGQDRLIQQLSMRFLRARRTNGSVEKKIDEKQVLSEGEEADAGDVKGKKGPLQKVGQFRVAVKRRKKGLRAALHLFRDFEKTQ